MKRGHANHIFFQRDETQYIYVGKGEFACLKIPRRLLPVILAFLFFSFTINHL